MARDILLTGIPRSGTTLAATQLEEMPHTICLHEPEWQVPSAALNAMQFAEALKEDFIHLRGKLLAGEEVMNRQAKDNTPLTNYYETGINGDMQMRYEMAPVSTQKLPADFTFAMKHNAPYLAILPELISLQHFDIRAVIRHPLPVLRSWRRLSLPVSRGELPNATRYWPQMKLLVEASMPLLEKQARMLELMMERILKYEAHLTILRYKELAKSEQAQQASEMATDEDGQIVDALKRYAIKTWRLFEQ